MEDEIRVLVVEDDENVRIGVEQAVALAGFPVQAFASAADALAQVAPGAPVVIVSDVRMPGIDGLQLLERVMAVDAQIPVVLISGHADISTAVGAMHDGAYDFIEKPFSSDLIAGRVARAVEKRRLTLEVQGLRAVLNNWQGIEALVLGKSPAMADVRKKILRLADTSVSVLITGETGTGKELIARSLHDFGGRRDAHFVALNCGGLPEQIFESELFGHEAGAFTGAIKKRIGKVEWAQGGTLFLDEIETMPIPLQIKMLRVLQERVVERLGANELIPVDCRVIAASKADLAELAADGRFRADLLYRLNVAQIELPPLRERREDVPLLFEHFVLAAARRFGQPAPVVSAAQVSELMTHAWPGNVRELQNVADRFVLGLTGDSLLSAGGTGAAGSTLAEQLAYFERMRARRSGCRRKRCTTSCATCGFPRAATRRLTAANDANEDTHRHGSHRHHRTRPHRRLPDPRHHARAENLPTERLARAPRGRHHAVRRRTAARLSGCAVAAGDAGRRRRRQMPVRVGRIARRVRGCVRLRDAVRGGQRSACRGEDGAGVGGAVIHAKPGITIAGVFHPLSVRLIDQVT